MSPTYRKLGKNGPNVSAIGFGMMGLSQVVYGNIPGEEDRFAILDRAHELGATFWDSSDLYGDNEQTLGKWFKRTGKRSDIFLATKFGFVKGKFPEVDSSGEYCKMACEESLKALGVDYIDLYYVHHANPKTPIEESIRAMRELQDAGKIKHIGLCSVSSTTLRRAQAVAPVSAVQVAYSPFDLAIEGPSGTDLLRTCRDLGISIISAMPLGRGILTSTFAHATPFSANDIRPKMLPRFQGESLQRNIEIVGKWSRIAKAKGCTEAQLAIAWLLEQGDDVFVIPGTKQIKFLDENCGAAELKLTESDVKEIRDFVEEVAIQGPAMPKGFEDYEYTNTAEEFESN